MNALHECHFPLPSRLSSLTRKLSSMIVAYCLSHTKMYVKNMRNMWSDFWLPLSYQNSLDEFFSLSRLCVCLCVSFCPSLSSNYNNNKNYRSRAQLHKYSFTWFFFILLFYIIQSRKTRKSQKNNIEKKKKQILRKFSIETVLY